MSFGNCPKCDEEKPGSGKGYLRLLENGEVLCTLDPRHKVKDLGYTLTPFDFAVLYQNESNFISPYPVMKKKTELQRKCENLGVNPQIMLEMAVKYAHDEIPTEILDSKSAPKILKYWAPIVKAIGDDLKLLNQGRRHLEDKVRDYSPYNTFISENCKVPTYSR